VPASTGGKQSRHLALGSCNLPLDCNVAGLRLPEPSVPRSNFEAPAMAYSAGV